MTKKRYVFTMILVMVLVSCQSGDDIKPEATPFSAQVQPLEVQESATPTAVPEPTQSIINPLTGLAVDDPALLDRRPVMVKVSNYPQYGRPHAGLSYADIVFEYYIGNGENRFLALFYGQDCDLIGPVRSGRFVDPQLVLLYSGILAYGSADEDTDAEINRKLGDYAISYLEAPPPAFTGVDPHSVAGLFANSDGISQFATHQGLSNKKPDLPGMTFSNNIPNHGRYADQLNVLFNYYNRGEWHYDASSGKYLRWIEYFEDEEDLTYDMIPLVDRVTGEQLGFSNIIVIFANHTELAATRYLIDIEGNNKGKNAYFFRNGQVFTGSWRSDNDTDPMQFFNDSGEPMQLKPGNTWVVIASMNSTYEEIDTAVWEMFFLP